MLNDLYLELKYALFMGQLYYVFNNPNKNKLDKPPPSVRSSENLCYWIFRAV